MEPSSVEYETEMPENTADVVLLTNSSSGSTSSSCGRYILLLWSSVIVYSVLLRTWSSDSSACPLVDLSLFGILSLVGRPGSFMYSE